MKTQEFDNNSPCPLWEVIISLRLAHSTTGFWCATSASWDTAAPHRAGSLGAAPLFLSPGRPGSVPALLRSPWFSPWLRIDVSCPPTLGCICSDSSGKEQYSHFPSCPAVRARKRGGSPSYCPATPSKRYTPRKTVFYLEIRSCQQTKPETSCCKTEKKILSFCSFKITHSIENTAWCPLLIPSASNLYILL